MQKMTADGIIAGFHIVRFPWLRNGANTDIDPKDALTGGDIAAPHMWSSFSGARRPSAEAPVRMTSIGVRKRQVSSTDLTLAGIPRVARTWSIGGRARSVGSRSWTRDKPISRITTFGNVENVVAAVMQIITGSANG